jgi:uncharacterized protein
MKRALAIFAKAPQAGRVKTRLTPPLSLQQGADLYRCMLLDTVSKMRLLPFETVIFYDGDDNFFRQALPGVQLFRQEGDCLGTRLEHAFTMLASAGYEARAVIGTDAPDLPALFVQQAFDLMENGSGIVFGPAEDGGYYLVGLTGGSGTLFRNIPWSGPDVLETSMERAREEGRTAALLPPWYDVDEVEDLYHPGLSDPANGAPLTRRFLATLNLASRHTAGAV